MPVVEGGATYQVPVADFRNAVWLPAPSSASENVENIHAAVEEATNNAQVGKTIFAPPGTYDVDDTMSFFNVTGLRFIGSGYQTVFRSTFNNPEKPIFQLAHCRQCLFEGFQVLPQGDAYAAFQLLRNDAEGASTAPTANILRNINIAGSGTIEHGVAVGGLGAVDANNDFNTFDHVRVTSYREAGWYMPNAQAYGTIMRGCNATAGSTGKYGVYTGTVGGQFQWYGGAMSSHSEADFYLGRSQKAYIIDGVDSEASARLLVMPNELYHQAVLRGIRWTAGFVAEDGKVIQTQGLTKLSIDSCHIGGSPAGDMYFDFVNTGSHSHISIRNSFIVSSAEAVFSSDAPDEVTGCTKITNETPATFEALTA